MKSKRDKLEDIKSFLYDLPEKAYLWRHIEEYAERLLKEIENEE